MDTSDRIMKEILSTICPPADDAFDVGRLLFERANEGTIPTSAGPLKPEQIVDECRYSSYRANRGKCSAAQLEKWFFPADGAAFEQRYQDEINAAKAKEAAA